MRCSAICSRVTRFTRRWQARLALLLVLYTSASFTFRSNSLLRIRNASTPRAAGGAPFLLRRVSRQNLIEPIIRKETYMNNEPDPRVQLAFERTFLAYERTRIAWVR